MTFVVLTRGEIYNKYHVDLRADLVVKEGIVAKNHRILQLIISKINNDIAQRSYLEADDAFYQKFSSSVGSATEEMKQSDEYKYLVSADKIFQTSMDEAIKLGKKGYFLSYENIRINDLSQKFEIQKNTHSNLLNLDGTYPNIKGDKTESLTPELLHFLFSKMAFGLRCVHPEKGRTNIQQAEYEQAHGALAGDCLNLDPSIPGVWKKFFPDDEKKTHGYYDDQELFRLDPDTISTTKKKEICDKWEEAVDYFINWKIGQYDFKPVFLLVTSTSKPGVGGYDFKYSKGLGKWAGKQMSNANSCILYPPPDLNLKRNELMRFYRSSLIGKIKEFRNNEEC